MIEPGDRVELAPGVFLEAGTIVDRVLRARIPVNATAALLLGHANGRTVAELGDVLACAGAGDGVRDARIFCARLNRRLLVNVQAPRGAPLRRRLATARFGLRSRVPLRRVDGNTTLKVIRGLAPVGFVLTLLALPFAVLAGSWWIAVSVGSGVVLHELAHSIALYGVPRALVLDGLRPSVLHPRLGTVRTVVVGAAGPLGPSLVALLLVVFVRSAGPASAPLAAHALGLTVLAPDGRNACGLS